MKYVSIDLETTGLDPTCDQILEFAAVVEDTESDVPIQKLPYFQTYIKHDRYVGHPIALSMNSEILKKCHSEGKILNQFLIDFVYWLNCEGFHPEYVLSVAGKNFDSFDRQFLLNITGFGEKIKLSHRSLDPAILFYQKGDDYLPNMNLCLLRAGIDKSVSHRALDDARDVIRLLRKGLSK